MRRTADRVGVAAVAAVGVTALGRRVAREDLHVASPLEGSTPFSVCVLPVSASPPSPPVAVGVAAGRLVAALLERDVVVLRQADVAVAVAVDVGVVADDLDADVARDRGAAVALGAAAVAAVGVAALGLGVAGEDLRVAAVALDDRRCRCRPASLPVSASPPSPPVAVAAPPVASLPPCIELDVVVLDDADVAIAVGVDVGVVADDLHADVAGDRGPADGVCVAAVAAVGVAALGVGVATEDLRVVAFAVDLDVAVVGLLVAGVGVAAGAAGRGVGRVAAGGLVAALRQRDVVVLDEADVAVAVGVDVRVVADDLDADVAGHRRAADRHGVAAVAALGLAALGLGVAAEDLRVAAVAVDLDVAVALLLVAGVAVAAGTAGGRRAAAGGLVGALRERRVVVLDDADVAVAVAVDVDVVDRDLHADVAGRRRRRRPPRRRRRRRPRPRRSRPSVSPPKTCVLSPSPSTSTLPLSLCVLPLSASPPAPPVAVLAASPPVAVLPPCVISRSLSWMTPTSPSPVWSMSIALTPTWMPTLPATAGPPMASASPPSPPSASPLSAVGVAGEDLDVAAGARDLDVAVAVLACCRCWRCRRAAGRRRAAAGGGVAALRERRVVVLDDADVAVVVDADERRADVADVDRALRADVAGHRGAAAGLGGPAVAALCLAALGVGVAAECLRVAARRDPHVAVVVLHVAAVAVAAGASGALGVAAGGLVAALVERGVVVLRGAERLEELVVALDVGGVDQDLDAGVAGDRGTADGVGVAAVAALGLAALGLGVAAEAHRVAAARRGGGVAVAGLDVAGAGVAAVAAGRLGLAAGRLVAALLEGRRVALDQAEVAVPVVIGLDIAEVQADLSAGVERGGRAADRRGVTAVAALRVAALGGGVAAERQRVALARGVGLGVAVVGLGVAGAGVAAVAAGRVGFAAGGGVAALVDPSALSWVTATSPSPSPSRSVRLSRTAWRRCPRGAAADRERVAAVAAVASPLSASVSPPKAIA